MAPYIGESYRNSVQPGLADELRLAWVALDATHEGILIHRTDGTIVLFNDAFARGLGYEPEEFAQLPPYGWSSMPSDADRQTRLDLIRAGDSYSFIAVQPLPDGGEVSHEVFSRYIDTPDGGLVVAVSHDVTQKLQAEKILRELAFQDPLTGLANRAAFDEQLESALASSRRHGDITGVIFIDLDDFKSINDEHGHEVGDDVLVTLGQRLAGAVRSEDTVARLGGDEFVVVLPRLDRPEDLSTVAAKLRDIISEPVRLEGCTLEVHGSTGSALFDPRGDDARSLLMRADVAMYESKRRARRVL